MTQLCYHCNKNDKCLYTKYVINNVKINEFDKIFNYYISTYNKKFDFYFGLVSKHIIVCIPKYKYSYNYTIK